MDQRVGEWRPGAIVWREAATTDLGRTTAFYSELLGWTHHDSPMGERGVYRHFQVGGKDVAGGYQLGPDMKGVPAHWMHYVSVANVDGAAEAVKANGGSVKMGPLDIPNVGRAAYCSDPQGGMFALFRDGKGDIPAAAPPYPGGSFCWETLNTSDPSAAVAFYRKIVGFQVTEFQGNTVLASGDKMEDGVADVQAAPPGVPSHWLSHVVVKSLAESRDRATALGAKVMMAEIVVPTVGTMAILLDPVGAAISLYEPEPRAS